MTAKQLLPAIAAICILFLTAGHANAFNTWNGLGRWLGVGRSDGYHAYQPCSYGGASWQDKQISPPAPIPSPQMAPRPATPVFDEPRRPSRPAFDRDAGLRPPWHYRVEPLPPRRR